jgi:hypothetical protein
MEVLNVVHRIHAKMEEKHEKSLTWNVERIWNVMEKWNGFVLKGEGGLGSLRTKEEKCSS